MRNGRLVTTIVKIRMNNWLLAETDESIVRARARSPADSGRHPRFSPGAGAVGCTHVHFYEDSCQAPLRRRLTTLAFTVAPGTSYLRTCGRKTLTRRQRYLAMRDSK